MKMNFISLHLQSQKNVISIKKAMESFLVLKHFFAGTAGLLRTLPTPGQASQPLLQPALAVPTLNQGICMDDLQRHLSTSAILWFCQVFAPKNRNNSKKKKKKVWETSASYKPCGEHTVLWYESPKHLVQIRKAGQCPDQNVAVKSKERIFLEQGISIPEMPHANPTWWTFQKGCISVEKCSLVKTICYKYSSQVHR